MRSGSALVAFVIVLLAAIAAPVGTAHAQGDDGGNKSDFKYVVACADECAMRHAATEGNKGDQKWGTPQAVDPSANTNEALDGVESQICVYSPNSPICTTVTIVGNGVHVIFVVLGASALVSVVYRLVRLLPL